MAMYKYEQIEQKEKNITQQQQQQQQCLRKVLLNWFQCTLVMILQLSETLLQGWNYQIT